MDAHRRPAVSTDASARALFAPLRTTRHPDPRRRRRARRSSRAPTRSAPKPSRSTRSARRSSSQFFENPSWSTRSSTAWSSRLAASVTVPLRQIIGMLEPARGVRRRHARRRIRRPVDFIDSGATAAPISRASQMFGQCHRRAPIRGLGSMGETVRQKVTIHGGAE